MAVSKVYHNSTTDDIYCLCDDISTGFGASPTVGDLLVGPSNGTTNPGSFVYQISGLQISPRGFKLNWIGRIKGANGADGYSPTVTVTEITGGHRITITDVNGDHTFDVMDGTGGGGGTSDYDDLSNKPQIGGVTLSGNKSLSDLGIAAASDIPAVPVQSVNNKTGTVVLTASDVGAGTYSKPSGGIPKTDLASGVQTSLGLADTAYQKPSGGIPASDLASGVIPSVPSASSATPQALGTAEAGSSADYSRADHKHDFNSDFVTALLQIASKVAYIDDHGATYYAALESALTHRTLSSISAVYTQSGTVYGTDTLDSLKADLVVTATYSDSSTATVAAADYTLSGTLTTGTSTITVSYGGKTTAFSVTVMENPIPAGYTVYDYIYNKHTNNNDISVDTQLGGAFCGTNYEHELTFLVTNAATSTSYPMYGLRATTGSDPRARALWSKATTNGNLACNYNGVDTGFVFNMATNTKYKCVTGNSQWKMNDVVIQDNMDGSSYTPPTTGTIRIFGIQTGSEVRAGYTRHNMRVYEFKVTDLTTGDVVADLIPVMNESGTAGLYDIVNKRFCTAIVASTIGAGND